MGGGRADDLDGHPRSMLDANPGTWDLSHMKGDARRRLRRAARDDRRVQQRHGLPIVQGWGMTETSPVASTARAAARPRGRRRGDALRPRWRWPGMPLAVRRGPRARRRRGDPVGRRGDGRARGARPVGRVGLLRHAGAGRPLDGRRLVQDRRHRLDPPARLHPDQGPLEGRDQVGRRVDLVGRARERADGASRRRRGGGDRDPRREVGRAAARGRRAEGGRRRRRRTSCASSSRRTSRSGGCRSGSSSSTRSRRRASASSARRRCASSSRRSRRRRLESRAAARGRRAVRARRRARARRPTARCSCACARPGVNFADVLDPARPVPADAGAAGRARLGDRRRARGRDARDGDHVGRRRLRGARRGRPRAGRAAARPRVVRGGRVVPAHVPDGVHPADAAGARSARVRRCSCTRPPAASARRRSSSRARSARAWSRRSARRRSSTSAASLGADGGVRLRRAAGRPRRSTSIVDPVGGELFAASFARLRPLGDRDRDRLRGRGRGRRSSPARLVGRNVGARRASTSGGCCGSTPELVGAAVGELLGALADGRAARRSSARSSRSTRSSARTSSSSRGGASARSCSLP